MKKTRFKAIFIAIFTCGFILTGCAKVEEIDMKKIKLEKAHVADIDVAYRVFGKGYPLVLIMGYSGTMDLWQPRVLAALARRYRVIIFDNRGMGETPSSEKPFSIEQFADDTAGLLDALGIKQAHVLGWSMGTNIALEFALRYPEKVNKLILYAADCGGKEAIQPSAEVVQAMTDTSGTEEERGMRMLKTLFPEQWLKVNPDPGKYFPPVTESSSPENIRRQWDAMMKWAGAYSRLKQIRQRTLLITGADDVSTPPANSLMLAGEIPGARLVQINGAGHGLMYQYPEEFSKTLLLFLED
jgi:pimeloyl-ACP methyl ester carboxylesterase